jgi:dTDP-4-dehydrorhamnose 3,5-epimerase-like enzyme
MEEIKLIKGGIAIDDRGEINFVNDFNFKDVKRFYVIKNHSKGFIRAWHGHKKEAKYFFVTEGAALLCAVEIDNWENPSKKLKINRFVLSSKSPSILYIPANHVNGSMCLTNDAKIIVFSTSSLEDSLNDDIRFDSRYWNPWGVEER